MIILHPLESCGVMYGVCVWKPKLKPPPSQDQTTRVTSSNSGKSIHLTADFVYRFCVLLLFSYSLPHDLSACSMLFVFCQTPPYFFSLLDKSELGGASAAVPVQNSSTFIYNKFAFAVLEFGGFRFVLRGIKCAEKI